MRACASRVTRDARVRGPATPDLVTPSCTTSVRCVEGVAVRVSLRLTTVRTTPMSVAASCCLSSIASSPSSPAGSAEVVLVAACALSRPALATLVDGTEAAVSPRPKASLGCYTGSACGIADATVCSHRGR